jgi:hypothetical protein
MALRKSSICSAALNISRGDGVSFPVVFGNDRMVERNIRGALLELEHGIAFDRHHLADQLIGFRERTAWVIDKTSLNVAPAFLETGHGRLRPAVEDVCAEGVGGARNDLDDGATARRYVATMGLYCWMVVALAGFFSDICDAGGNAERSQPPPSAEINCTTEVIR